MHRKNIPMKHHTPNPGRQAPRRSAATLADIAEIHQRNHAQNSKNVCRAMLRHLREFLGKEPAPADLTAESIAAFAMHLRQRLAHDSSVRTYLQKLGALLEAAVEQGAIPSSPMPRISRLVPYTPPASRTFLTDRELVRLERTPCRNAQVKNAFLLACLTGLRLSDIETLSWQDIRPSDNGLCIDKCQRKTRRRITVPLGKSALRLLPPAGGRHSGRVFSLPSRTTIAAVLVQWSLAAGIDKHVTFHASRHTFATMLISSKVEIYTVSKLCGHTNVKTTEIYAHILDSSLRDGINRYEKTLLAARKSDKKTHGGGTAETLLKRLRI